MDRIDTSRCMSITGSVTRDLSRMTHDPFHETAMDLAQQHLNPAFLRLAEPIEQAATEVPALPFVEWLIELPAWYKEFFYNLQSMSQTALGEPLLTTWLSAERFLALLQDGRGVPAIEDLAQRTAQWQGLALDEVYFDFYERGSSAVDARVEISAEPITC